MPSLQITRPFLALIVHQNITNQPEPKHNKPTQNPSMKSSKYAPKTPLEQLKQSKAETLKQDKNKATRLMSRLQWKADLLIVSYKKAMTILQECQGHDESHKGLAREAESMFKIDFFEFYAHLERYVTSCLSIFGISVSPSVPQHNFNALRCFTNASHAYHANVLEALDDEQCPLHNALGTLDVRSQLGLAKDFRNAWKDAGKEVSDKYDQRDSVKNVKLPNLGLETMIITLINGCANANVVVQAYEGVDVSGSGLSSRDFKPPSHTNNSVVVNNTPFEFMDDMMDLD
jgi:hypothetical protein